MGPGAGENGKEPIGAAQRATVGRENLAVECGKAGEACSSEAYAEGLLASHASFFGTKCC